MRQDFEYKAIEYSRGKIAGHDVRDDQNQVIVPKGKTITDEDIRIAQDKGKLHYLMLAAAASVVQAGGADTRERLQEFRDVTEGHEVDFVRGQTAGRDVRNVGGEIIVSQGETITDETINLAERQGMLQELVLAVGAPGVFAAEEAEEEEEGEKRERPATKMGYTPYPH